MNTETHLYTQMRNSNIVLNSHDSQEIISRKWFPPCGKNDRKHTYKYKLKYIKVHARRGEWVWGQSFLIWNSSPLVMVTDNGGPRCLAGPLCELYTSQWRPSRGTQHLSLPTAVSLVCQLWPLRKGKCFRSPFLLNISRPDTVLKSRRHWSVCFRIVRRIKYILRDLQEIHRLCCCFFFVRLNKVTFANSILIRLPFQMELIVVQNPQYKENRGILFKSTENTSPLMLQCAQVLIVNT